MKVLCKVNNYQYGMAQFKRIREQFAYKDELVNEKLHEVYLEFDPSQFNLDWLKRLINGKPGNHDRVIVL